MKFAVIENDFVTNIIVADETQREELERALNAELIDAAPLDMQIGDYYNGKTWTRNVDGEQVALPLGDNPAVDELLAMLGGVF